jgi:ATP-dependent protease HslVU (ClpYQ) peptidase subunit
VIGVAEADIIYAISDEISLVIFKAIATTDNSNNDLFKKQFKFTARQYYRRISRMMKVGLIKREKRKYVLTSLGKVVYEAESTIAMGSLYYWKLKALDAILLHHPRKEPLIEEYSRFIDNLIENQKIKEILK